MTDAWIDPDYEIPSSGDRYLQPSKLEDGSHLIRILDKPVMGEELWIGGRPIRKEGRKVNWTLNELENADIDKYTNERRDPVAFWAVPVWNYEKSLIQILHITQRGIQQDLLNLSKNPKWGSPTQYDVSIVKGKDGQRTTYSVTPDPKEELADNVAQAWKNVTIDMDEYFKEGGHPIETGSSGQGVTTADAQEVFDQDE